jgi:hypothetical protein
MKKPWLTFAGMCSVVLAIVLLSVIFGSYTSMLRSKNRINTGKNLLVQDCRNQLDLVPQLVSLAPETFSDETVSRIQDTEQRLQKILDSFQATKAPLDLDLVAAFENTQASLAKDLDVLTTAIGKDHALSKEMHDLYLKTIYSAKRYNKEARYFATRKTVFPGFFTARWFHLDALDFPYIELECFTPWGLK